MDSNCGPLVKEANTLPIELQSLLPITTLRCTVAVCLNYCRGNSSDCIMPLILHCFLTQILHCSTSILTKNSILNALNGLILNKWAILGLLFVYFFSFKKHYNFYKKIMGLNCPFCIWWWDSNPRPLRHESPHITTRPGLLIFHDDVTTNCCRSNDRF